MWTVFISNKTSKTGTSHNKPRCSNLLEDTAVETYSYFHSIFLTDIWLDQMLNTSAKATQKDFLVICHSKFQAWHTDPEIFLCFGGKIHITQN